MRLQSNSNAFLEWINVNDAIRIQIILIVTLFGTFTLRANSSFELAEASVYTSQGGMYLARIEPPQVETDVASNSKELVSIMKYEKNANEYKTLYSFSIGGMPYPRQLLLTTDGDYIVAINYDVRWGIHEPVVEIYGKNGHFVKGLEIGDIWTADNVDVYQKADKRPTGRWVEEAYIPAGRHIVLLKCRGVTLDRSIDDYIILLDESKVVPALLFQKMGKE